VPVPTDIDDLDTVAANNSPSGSDQRSQADDYLRAHAAIIKQLETDLAADSTGIGFVQAGSGAVTRTAQNKMRDIFHAKDFGVVADGSTNDHTALTAALAAIDANGGGELLLPVGTICLSTSALTLPENLTITGHSREASQIKVNGAFVGFQKLYANHSDVNRLNLHVRHVGFIGAVTALGAFRLDFADYFHFEHCGFTDFQASNAYGMRWINCYRGGVSYSHFENIDKYGILMEADSSIGCNATTIGPRNEIIGNNEASFIGLAVNGQGIEIYGNDITGAGNGLHAIQLENTEGCHIHDNYIEQWTGHAVKADSGSANLRLVVENNVIHSLDTYVLDLDHASVNTKPRVYDNRFADLSGSQTCIKFGSSTFFRAEGNDISSAAAESDKAAAHGNGAAVLEVTASWNPADIAPQVSTQTEVSVTGAVVGDPVVVSHNQLPAGNLTLTGFVRTAGTVRVILVNNDTGNLNVADGTLRIMVFKGSV
jgi:hypothetical protein